MDTSEYMPMFVAETREHLDQLNLAIVRLEEDPKDRATVEEIFRIAHSLKGMSATMGFSRIAELTHEMEDVFELLRQRTNGLPVEAIDTVMRLGANHPMGPLQLADFIGLDTCLAVMQVLHEGLADSKYRPCPLLVKYVEAGWLGRKTQRGFYDYRGEKPVPTR